jgi:peroxiredoxin Q/BCP
MKIRRILALLGIVGAVAWWTLPSYGDAIQVGQLAPEFSLKGSDGKTYTLSQFRDKKAVVLAWFPKAFTGGCTAECKSMADSSQAIQAFDVAYFAASVDQPETNNKFAEQLGVTFPILSDPTRVTARAYGVTGGLPFAKRWTFYVGKDGKVLKVDRSIKTSTAGADLAKNLEELGIPKRS